MKKLILVFSLLLSGGLVFAQSAEEKALAGLKDGIYWKWNGKVEEKGDLRIVVLTTSTKEGINLSLEIVKNAQSGDTIASFFMNTTGNAVPLQELEQGYLPFEVRLQFDEGETFVPKVPSRDKNRFLLGIDLDKKGRKVVMFIKDAKGKGRNFLDHIFNSKKLRIAIGLAGTDSRKVIDFTIYGGEKAVAAALVVLGSKETTKSLVKKIK